MASKKLLSGEVVVNLLEQVVEGLDHLRTDLGGRIDATNDRLDATNDRLDGMSQRIDGLSERVDGTNRRLDRLEQAVVGIGRMTALETRVQRLEERAGTEPPR
jgi:archaellum component FlaC